LDAKVSPTLRQRCGNGAVVDLCKEHERREVHMKTAMDASTPSPGTGDEVLVDPGWLQAHLSDPRVRVVEVDVSPAAYDDWHIDGAVLWNIYADLKDADYRLAEPAALGQLVARSGIGPDSTVVFYGYGPALGLWLMKLYGHPDVRILDCSRDTWRAEGYSWSTAASEPPAGGGRLGDEDPRIRAGRTAVREAISQPGTTLVDVRSAAEYEGERFWPSGGMEPGGRAGHIPSAIHQPIDGLYNDDGSFRSAAELRQLFAPEVLEGGDGLITYCTIGGRAATAWFVLTHLIGRDNVRVYDGSWAEWGRIPDTPVVAPLPTPARRRQRIRIKNS
jgi:thiosulfate/3-mercaptopyruvate sulfurtransferase